MAYDYNRPFVERENLSEYVATDKTVRRPVRFCDPGDPTLQQGVQNPLREDAQRPPNETAAE